MTKNEKKWQEWMGYSVYLVKDGKVCRLPGTDYGITKAYAMRKMKILLQRGQCAWMGKVDPARVEEIPF